VAAVVITPCKPELAVLTTEPTKEPTALELTHTSSKKYTDQITTPTIAPKPALLIRLSFTDRKQAMNKAMLTVNKVQTPTLDSMLRIVLPKLSESSSSESNEFSQDEIPAAREKFVKRNWKANAITTPAINATKNCGAENTSDGDGGGLTGCGTGSFAIQNCVLYNPRIVPALSNMIFTSSKLQHTHFAG
jgi:hypothetical protein